MRRLGVVNPGPPPKTRPEAYDDGRALTSEPELTWYFPDLESGKPSCREPRTNEKIKTFSQMFDSGCKTYIMQRFTSVIATCHGIHAVPAAAFGSLQAVA